MSRMRNKVAAVFESYWNSGDFVPYDAETFAAETTRSASGSPVFLSPIELRPELFRERLLEQIALARERGHHHNLLVSATGTGKTVMAAIDYARRRGALIVAATGNEDARTVPYPARDPRVIAVTGPVLAFAFVGLSGSSLSKRPLSSMRVRAPVQRCPFESTSSALIK